MMLSKNEEEIGDCVKGIIRGRKKMIRKKGKTCEIRTRFSFVMNKEQAAVYGFLHISSSPVPGYRSFR